ncbi:hypothetical protein [Methylibium sp.]|uniref:hypothetical protein n=1 Tax=Methylibium sp. TaxID=2067992 RepID=UPI00286B3203|nr:hypothetical protein [Methylibium sp.]
MSGKAINAAQIATLVALGAMAAACERRYPEPTYGASGSASAPGADTPASAASVPAAGASSSAGLPAARR